MYFQNSWETFVLLKWCPVIYKHLFSNDSPIFQLMVDYLLGNLQENFQYIRTEIHTNSF